VAHNPASRTAAQIVGVSAGAIPAGSTTVSRLGDGQALGALHFHDFGAHSRILKYQLRRSLALLECQSPAAVLSSHLIRRIRPRTAPVQNSPYNPDAGMGDKIAPPECKSGVSICWNQEAQTPLRELASAADRGELRQPGKRWHADHSDRPTAAKMPSPSMCVGVAFTAVSSGLPGECKCTYDSIRTAMRESWWRPGKTVFRFRPPGPVTGSSARTRPRAVPRLRGRARRRRPRRRRCRQRSGRPGCLPGSSRSTGRPRR
jgi:hypothetical protein